MQVQGNIITTLGQQVFIGVGNVIYTCDDRPPPIVNRPPVALPQNVNLWENSPTNLTLTGRDADSDTLNFTVLTLPTRGTLSGTPPNLTFTPGNNASGMDSFSFVVVDGAMTSPPAFFNLAINPLTNILSTIAFTNPVDGNIFIGATNLTLAAAASTAATDSIRFVNFYSGGTIIHQATNPPYVFTTNLVVGDYTFSARAISQLGARTWSAPVRVSVLPVAPRTTIKQVDAENVAVTWPLELDGFFLETANDLNGPWTLAPQPPLFFSNGQIATIPLAGQQFFRLMHPR